MEPPRIEKLPYLQKIIAGLKKNADQIFINRSTEWQMPKGLQHPFIKNVREAIETYRRASAEQFCIPIDVAEVEDDLDLEIPTEITPSTLVAVGFYTFATGPSWTLLRPKLAKLNCGNAIMLIKEEVEAITDQKIIPLDDFLNVAFPTYGVPVSSSVMYDWWGATGKVFNWAGLPAEIKERFVQICMNKVACFALGMGPRRGNTRARRTRPTGPVEVTRLLGDWSSLLHVNMQVRAITLRLCFIQSKDLIAGDGLCISVPNSRALQDCLVRLGRAFQMVTDNGVPFDDKTRRLAMAYAQYPKIYPQLEQYATFSHGIRKLFLQMDFFDALHFFKVTKGNFQRSHRPGLVTCDVLEQLPHLNELRIVLPNFHTRLVNLPEYRIAIFYAEPLPCIRTLHRLIYENMVEPLAKYENLKVFGFLDGEEHDRFYALRKVAVKAYPKLTDDQLNEIYADEEGGVKLDKYVIPCIHSRNKGKKNTDVRGRDYLPAVQGDFWPPKCECTPTCRRWMNHPNRR